MFLGIFFAGWPPAKRSALKVFLAKYQPPSNESDTVDNNGDNEALPKGSDTRDTRTENNDSSAPKKEARCSPLDQLVDAATAKTVQKVEDGADPKTVQKVEEGAKSESHIASNASSNNVSGEKHPNDNPNELAEKEESNENPEKLCKKEEFETVSKAEESAVNATDIASDTNNHNVGEPKISSKNPNKLDETKGRLSNQSNADGNDSNQDGLGVQINAKADALAKAPASPKNTGSTSKINLFDTSSESESAAEEDDGPHDVQIPYSLATGKWDYIMCDINNIKKHAENEPIEVDLRIQTCFYRRGQYQGYLVSLRSEFVLVWHFLCYLFNFLCCPF